MKYPLYKIKYLSLDGGAIYLHKHYHRVSYYVLLAIVVSEKRQNFVINFKACDRNLHVLS